MYEQYESVHEYDYEHESCYQINMFWRRGINISINMNSRYMYDWI